MKLTIISKSTCPICNYMLSWLNTLPTEQQSQIGILDDSTSSSSDLYKILDSYDTSGFPTLILHGHKDAQGNDRIISGFAEITKPIIEKHLSDAN